MNNRNQTCHCGSNKKYKKCCLIKEWEAERKQDIEDQAWLENDFKIGAEILAQYEQNQ